MLTLWIGCLQHINQGFCHGDALTYMFDTVCTNCSTLMRDKRPTENISSFKYVWNLGEDLIRRLQNPVGLQAHIVSAMKEFLHVDVAQPIVGTNPMKVIENVVKFVC